MAMESQRPPPNCRLVTRAVRPLVRGMSAVLVTSARVISSRIVLSRRASIDFPASTGPSNRGLRIIMHAMTIAALDGASEGDGGKKGTFHSVAFDGLSQAP